MNMHFLKVHEHFLKVNTFSQSEHAFSQSEHFLKVNYSNYVGSTFYCERKLKKLQFTTQRFDNVLTKIELARKKSYKVIMRNNTK